MAFSVISSVNVRFRRPLERHNARALAGPVGQGMKFEVRMSSAYLYMTQPARILVKGNRFESNFSHLSWLS